MAALWGGISRLSLAVYDCFIKCMTLKFTRVLVSQIKTVLTASGGVGAAIGPRLLQRCAADWMNSWRNPGLMDKAGTLSLTEH